MSASQVNQARPPETHYQGKPLPYQFEDNDPRRVVAVTGVVTDAWAHLLLFKGDRQGWEPPGGQV
jgi:hypothetical protein